MDIRDVPLHDLILDPNLNLRDRLDTETVERYTEAWSRMPPVTVFEVDGRLLLADGFHRHAAAVTLGRKAMPAEIRQGTFAEALDYVAGANLHHGLPLSRTERRRAIEVKLLLHHERSDRHLAEELYVGRELIAKVRRHLIESGQIPASGTRLGADGKLYPAMPKDPNERRPTGPPIADREDPRDRGGREADAPWDDTRDPLPPIVQEGPPRPGALPPWEEATNPKAIALSPPIEPAAPTIDELIALMTRQIVEVVTWTHAEGFDDSYRTAAPSARGLFQTAALKLAARADRLRKG